MKITDTISHLASASGATAKSLAKILLQSRKTPSLKAESSTLIILGNGPSLRTNIEHDLPTLQSHPTLAVNFAANATAEYSSLHPRYYVLADPHFFAGTDPNVVKLFDNINSLTSWTMTLFVPAKMVKTVSAAIHNPNITVAGFNPIGAEGFGWFERLAYRARRAMPRPRNVLIPSIMIGIWLGFKHIIILGADHSWLRTLEVDDNNQVVTVQPHFYADSASERSRVTSVYRDVRLHDILMSFHVAFRSYHRIAAFAKSQGVEILNATPASYIDAFPRINKLNIS